jgi:excinuclease ABC subunit C
VLSRALTFSPDQDASFFQELPAAAAVFLLRGDGDPYVSKTANLRRRMQRLLGPPLEHSRRLNLRDRVRGIEFTPTGSDFESQFLLYQVLRQTFPRTYAARLRLRSAPLVKLHLENEYPRASVTTRLGKISASERTLLLCHSERSSATSDATVGTQSRNLSLPDLDAEQRTRINLYYGPFPSRPAAEKFASDALDFFKMRRCVEDLHPDPAFPGCVYSEMKMCLAPCFKGCTDDDYHAEVARVEEFFNTGGESLLRDFARQRDRASTELAFENAAAIHTRIEKLKPLISQLPEIVRRIDQLKALIIQPSAQLPVAVSAGTEPPTSADTGPASTEQEPAHSVCLFLFEGCALSGPIDFSIKPHAQSQSMESRVAETIAALSAPQDHPTAERIEHLSILKRWFYRSNRIGEIFLADNKGEWPFRRIVRGIGRVYRGENPQEPAPLSATEGPVLPS